MAERYVAPPPRPLTPLAAKRRPTLSSARLRLSSAQAMNRRLRDATGGQMSRRYESWWDWIVWRQPSWLTSLLVHLLLLLVLGLVLLPAQPSAHTLTLDWSDTELLDGPLESVHLTPSEPPELPPLPTPLASLPIVAPDRVESPLVPVATAELLPAGLALATDVSGEGALAAPGGFTGRQGRRGNALAHGATAESEAAVDRALVWLAAHQQRDGCWNFDLSRCGCGGRCGQSGVGVEAVNGATALALLPFLGAGQTHERGYHRHVVERGLLALLARQNNDGSFLEPTGTMYSHGLATLVLCESLGMTKTDPGASNKSYRRQTRLKACAQRAVDFLVAAQASDGGWRYVPRQPGDTSVVGWQAMALQSAKLSGLRVPPKVLKELDRFLDRVQADDYGAQYGYITKFPRPTTNAVGLLCRMYGGWNRNSAGIIAGAEQLREFGPSSNNVYYNYYATQVLHHFGGPHWEAWHPTLRDYLVGEQVREGHEAGSWYFTGDHGSSVGGRLYITAMSAMILEVYYRHLPIYGTDAVVQSADQPLELPE